VKFGITARLAVVLALIGMAVSGLTGFYAYSVSRDLLIQSAQGELMTSTQVVARRISQTRQELSRNLMLLAAQPEALVALKAQCARSSSSARLALEFRELMRVNPSYFQLRLISAAEGGPECVRVDRDANALLEISGDDLQEKGHFMYVTEALKLKPGQTYLSQITINHERGAHAGQEKPTVILSTPVVDAQGKAVGVIVINVDLNGMFSLLAADLPGDHRLYLSNHRGDFLIHPDSTRTFGFDRGQRVLLQDEFPQTVDVVAGKEKSVLLETQANAEGTPPPDCSLYRQQRGRPRHGRKAATRAGTTPRCGAAASRPPGPRRAANRSGRESGLCGAGTAGSARHRPPHQRHECSGPEVFQRHPGNGLARRSAGRNWHAGAQLCTHANRHPPADA
jgi:hypothetical protein